MKAYGAGAYAGAEIIGGTLKSGVTPAQATRVVASGAELKDALREQIPADVIYLDEDHEFDVTDWPGSPQSWKGPVVACAVVSNGALVKMRRLLSFSAGRFNTLFTVTGRMSGIRLFGPDQEIASGEKEWWTGILVKGAGLVDNMELFGWNYGGAVTWGTDAMVRLNDIHHCQRDGMGYGVQMCAGYSLVELNKFDYCRHHITADRGPGVNFMARYNIFGPNCTHTLADVHGNADSGYTEYPKYAAGGQWSICFNDFLQAVRSSVGVRGTPGTLGKVYRNWTHHPETNSLYAFRQDVSAPYRKIDVFENFYGPTPPPDVAPEPEPPPVCPPCPLPHCNRASCPALGDLYQTVSCGEDLAAHLKDVLRSIPE